MRHALGSWLVIPTYPVGAVEFLNVTTGEPTVYLFPAWIAHVSLVVLVRTTSGRLDDASTRVCVPVSQHSEDEDEQQR